MFYLHPSILEIYLLTRIGTNPPMYTTSMNLEFQMALHTYNAAYHKQKRGTCKNLGETFYLHQDFE